LFDELKVQVCKALDAEIPRSVLKDKTGVSSATMGKWHKLWTEGGEEALTTTILTDEQEALLKSVEKVAKAKTNGKS